MTALETIEPQVELSDESSSVVLSLSDGVINLDEQGTKVLTVQATALAEGVWNGLYFKPEDIKANLQKLDGKRVLVSHTYEKPDDVMGWVENIDSESGQATLRIFDSDSIDKIQDGTYNSVSVGVLVQQTNGVASILGFNEISLTGNPACSTCVINSYTEQTLEENGDDMTDNEIVEEEAQNEELENCACEEPVVESPVLEETHSTLEAENESLRAELEAMKENITVLRQHKEMLELERKTAERSAIVENLCDDGAFKPANAEQLQALLMSFNDEQMELFHAATPGFGAVVLEEDLGEVEYIPPQGTAQMDLEQDLADFRAAMGIKTNN